MNFGSNLNRLECNKDFLQFDLATKVLSQHVPV